LNHFLVKIKNKLSCFFFPKKKYLAPQFNFY
jgi:hypothetical protein